MDPEENDTPLETLVSSLASSKLDAASSASRTKVIQEATQQVTEDAEARLHLAGMTVTACPSAHACKRVVRLYCTALLSSQDEEEVTISGLCQGLCDFLAQSRNPSLITDCRQRLVQASSPQNLAKAFYHVASNAATPAYAPALALGSALDDKEERRQEWLQHFVQRTLTGPTAFAPAWEIELSKLLLESVTQEEWNTILASVIGLKLRANPERALETVMATLEGLLDIDVSDSLEGEVQLLSSVLKQMKSSKAAVRDLAQSVITRLALLQPRSAALPKIVTALADALTSSLIQPDQRYGAYAALKDIAIQTNNIDLESRVLASLLSGLSNAFSKETKSATLSREVGLDALIQWMVVSKRNSGGNKGYDEALALLRKPLLENNSSECALYLGTLLVSVNPDVLESIVLDLWKDSKLEKGLQSVVEASTKKHNASSTVPPVEGLVSVYLALVQALASGAFDLNPAVAKVLSEGSLPLNKTSFVFGQAMTDAVAANALVGQVLPRTIALYTKLLSKQDGEESAPLMSMLGDHDVTAATRALAACVTHPSTGGGMPTMAILSSVQTVLTYEPTAADAIVEALMVQVNEYSLQTEKLESSLNETREAREEFSPIQESYTKLPVKGGCSATASHVGLDPNAVRRVAHRLVSHTTNTERLAQSLLLMHLGTTLKSVGKQRSALISNSLQVLEDVIIPMTEKEDDPSAVMSTLADLVSSYACSYHRKDSDSTESTETVDSVISVAVHQSALSLVTSMGGIASNFDPAYDDPSDDDVKPSVFARTLCTQELAPRFATGLKDALKQVEALSEKQIDLYRSPMGVLYYEEGSNGASKRSSGPGNDKVHNVDKKRAGGKSRRTRGDFGAGFEDEEWERQMKKELEEKKKKESVVPGRTSLSPEEKKLVAQQDQERRRITGILDGDYSRVLSAVQCLCLSDIEVGNSCLPVLYESVIASAVSSCKALQTFSAAKTKSFQTLTTLAACVYEIDEDHAPTLANALTISCREVEPAPTATEDGRSTTATGAIAISALPSPCAPAACVVYEMEEFNDKLSGSSFVFLFPVLRAALTGPRTAPGCEEALRVLDRHTTMLAGDEVDPSVQALRKDMVIAVLELLSHDRSQKNVDPTPFEVIVNCYRTNDVDASVGPALSTAELAPLLDERGALGSKNCRVGSMVALESIARDHQKLIKNNPLIENRIWMNCFDKNESIRNAARKTWWTANGQLVESSNSPLPPPSVMYAMPLLPLLSHSDQSVVAAAADAFAHAMGMHPTSVERNVQKLCSTYIESYPSVFGEEKGKALLPSSGSTKKPLAAPAPPKKKPTKISTGLPKKKPSKKSALAVAGIGKPKTAPKKKTMNSALLAPKKERTLDREALESQFLSDAQRSDPADKDSPRKVAIRLGVLRAITALTDTGTSTKVALDISTLKLLTGFLMAYGLADGNESVQGAARNALRDIVASNGGSDEAIAFLLPQLETVLSTGVADESCLGSLSAAKVPRDVAASDRRKEGAVVALGSVALHLKGPESEGKIDSTVDMLINALKTPSEGVQSSVADCLAKLMKKGRTQDRVEQILSDLMKECLHGDSLASRRGAAYGISAAVKGSGIASLKKYEVVKQLEEACTSGSSSAKEGALFAIELLSGRLGLLFEPYVIVLLPSLLKAFSDSSDYVRTAASNTAGLIMSKLSAHGVKLVLPAVLTAFDDPAWRTKQASIHMLGSMSHLAPKQLASALPKVVPKLTEAFSDTHPKVKSSAEEALQEITKVIKNPEISGISPILLKALTDPAEGTVRALEGLIETEFLHAIDAPSLALIVPVLHRGLRDRGAKSKRYGALIAGNICTMIDDPRDFVPYLPVLLPDLKSVLLDPIPDVRSTSAKALGSLTRGLGEDALADLRPWLIETLREDNKSSAERSGAAQGLTELLIAGGAEVVDIVMREEILPLRSHPQASTREGVLWVLTFLPSALGQAFTPLIDSSLPALLGGLSDDSEPVRDVAMRAGRVLIRSHGKAHVDKILPSLEAGLDDEDYRIRLASLTLLGDLLSMIGGTTVVRGDGDTQDDFRKAERAQAQVALVLGNETRKRVLSGLYLARCDTVAVVRQSAIQVWKTVVSVTARTLRDILQVLVRRVVAALASGHPERTQVAGRCLGDITNKLGESVLPEIIPVLRDALYTGDTHTRRGVCVGLSEVISGSTREQILRFLEIIVKLVRDALCDDDEGVRQMAASCYANLSSVVGSRAQEEVVPALLVALEDEDSEDTARVRALNGLTGILSIRSRELLPYIIPRLLRRPISKNHADALSGIAAVTGGTIHMHFSSIIPSLIAELGDLFGVELTDDESERIESVRVCARSVCGNVEEGGVNWLISEIASKCSSDKDGVRKESCWMFQVVVEERKNKQDFYEQIPIILRELLYRFNDENPHVLKAAHDAFNALSKHVPAEELVKHIEFIRNLIASMVSDARRRKGGVGDAEFLLPGFNIPKGLEPLLPIYQRGILYGNATIREASAAGLGELIALTSTKYLAGPLIIKMTGPLLRIVGDRNPSAVKIAILQTLGMVLVKGGPALRAFVPQFQTTFVKALSDPSRQVRLEAIKALALLMPLSTRVDPLVKELVSGSLGKSGGGTAETAGVAAVQTATLEALAVVLKQGGKKAKLPDSIPSALDASKELLGHEDDGVREGAAKVMGAACELLGVDVTTDVVQEEVLTGRDNSSDVRHGKVCVCHRIMASSVGPELLESVRTEMTNLIVSCLKDDKSAVKEAACVAIGAAVGSAPDPTGCLRDVESVLLEIMNDTQERMEVHRALARGLCLALRLSDTDGVDFLGKVLLDASLKMAMSGAQRVQYAYNDVLWLALDVAKGESGLEKYTGMAAFDNSKAMKSLYTKVLLRIKEVSDED